MELRRWDWEEGWLKMESRDKRLFGGEEERETPEVEEAAVEASEAKESVDFPESELSSEDEE